MVEEQVTDAEIEKLEEELKKLEGKDTSYGSPTAIQKDGLFKFCREILVQEDTTRIGNLSNIEIGMSRLSVRGYKHIAAYANVEGLDVVKEYFLNQSNILTESSMAKKGFWAQLFFTNIRKEHKVKDSSGEKKGWFGQSKKEGE